MSVYMVLPPTSPCGVEWAAATVGGVAVVVVVVDDDDDDPPAPSRPWGGPSSRVTGPHVPAYPDITISIHP